MSAAPPLDPIVFYIDTCLGRKCLEALRAAGMRVEWHHDHFAMDAPDVDWIPEVSRKGWVILSKDKAIRVNTAEFEALVASRARLFVLGRGNYTGQGMINILMTHLDKMVVFAASNPGPFIVSLSTKGFRVAYPRVEVNLKADPESSAEQSGGVA